MRREVPRTVTPAADRAARPPLPPPVMVGLVPTIHDLHGQTRMWTAGTPKPHTEPSPSGEAGGGESAHK